MPAEAFVDLTSLRSAHWHSVRTREHDTFSLTLSAYPYIIPRPSHFSYLLHKRTDHILIIEKIPLTAGAFRKQMLFL